MSIRATAKEVNALSEILDGREQVKVRDFVGAVRIEHLYCHENDNKEVQYIVTTTIDGKPVYFYAPTSFTKVINTELETNGGDIEAINRELENEPLIIKFDKINLKEGKTYITFKIM